MEAHDNEKIEKISLSPTKCCALLVNLFVTLRQSDSSVEEKIVKYWPEICKLLPRDKNVQTFCVFILYTRDTGERSEILS